MKTSLNKNKGKAVECDRFMAAYNTASTQKMDLKLFQWPQMYYLVILLLEVYINRLIIIINYFISRELTY